MRRLLGVFAAVTVGVLAMMVITAVQGRPLYPDAIERGLIISGPAALLVSALGWWRRRRT